jgi:hypothetical protein
MDEQKFKGMPYPIVKHPRGYMRTQWGVNQIKSDLLILLLTNPGERVMLPSFGTPLRRLFFEPNDEVIRAEAREMIIDSLNQWEPRIAVTNVEVWTGTGGFSEEALDPEEEQTPENEEHILGIKITFVDPEDIQTVQELVLQVPIVGGGTL